ncbi:MAG: SDR family NAD(P)-dependent oxidoreductase [Bifidobacteriaceae bacterium]|jgi:NAD(P)-dependent dehydrogenase (short-subunit alcohol dehydrogenase family)|nr:SDR family NAD(P)-dependent oxidoreductase [Bifidobacteriaceae bacterium]
MSNKIILVTGASGGIGKETALALARLGHHVIVHGRDAEKTQAAQGEIRKATGSASLDMLTADLSLMSEVKHFSDELKARYDVIDVLINNAGAQFGTKREVTAEGHEKTMAINLFAPFLLTHLMLDPLRASTAGRVVTVSSESYKMGGKPDLSDIELRDNYSMGRAYGFSKLYVIWIMRRFAEEARALGASNVTFNSLEPGSAATDLGRVSTQSPMTRLMYFLWKPMMWSLQKAAATSVYLATSEEVASVTGGFFGNCQEKAVRPALLSPEGEQVVWNYCAEVCADYLKDYPAA